MTNFSLNYLRNKTRYQIIPLIESIFPEIKKQLLHLSSIASEEDKFIDSIAKKETEIIRNNDQYSLILLKRLPIAIKRRVIKDILGDEANFERIENLINFFESNSRRINIAKNIFIKKDSSKFWFEKKAPFTIVSESTISIPGNTTIEEAGIEIKAYITKKLPELNNFKVAFDLNKLKLPLKIRFRKEGDAIQLENGVKKLQDLLVDAKIRRDQRYKVPIIVDGCNKILWVVGIRRSTLAKIEKKRCNVLILEANFNKN
jgi:tRNA(Ile)-lysidine synthase